MAEAIGLAAAAVQFVDISAKLLIAASRLRSKLQNAPARIKRTERSIKQLVSFAEGLHSELQSSGQSSLADLLSDAATLEAVELLEDCKAEVDTLGKLLQGLLVKAEDSSFRGQMRSFVTVKREEEIEEHSKRLEELKAQLSLWYHHQSLLLLRQQMMDLTTMKLVAESIDHRVEAAFSAVQQPLKSPQSSTGNFSSLTRETCYQIVSKPSLLPDLIRRGGHSRERSIQCLCRALNVTRNRFRAAPFFFDHNSTPRHEPACPLYERQAFSHCKFGLRLVVPQLLSHCVLLTFESRVGAGGFSFSPRISATNIVDRFKSPTFLRLSDARQEIENMFGYIWDETTITSPVQRNQPSGKLDAVRGILDNLIAGMADDFQNGKSCGADQDAAGITLLHELIPLMNMLWYLQDLYMQPIQKAVELLVHYGVDMNAEKDDLHFQRQRTALSLLLKDNVDIGFGQPTAVADGPRFDQLLCRYGAEMSCFQINEHYPWELGFFSKNEDLAIDFGCSRLCLAIVNRDKAQLLRLIDAGHHVNETTSSPYSPLCFAIGWFEGMKILLRAGANPSGAIHAAVAYSDNQALQLLLGAGSHLFAPPGAENTQWYPCADKRLAMTIASKIADSRRLLMDKAKENIPMSKLKSLGWRDLDDENVLLDHAAGRVAETLQAIGISIADNLFPGTTASVYHQTFLPVETANHLFSLGFKEPDQIDEWGSTPLLVCSSLTTLRVEQNEAARGGILWLLDHGARTTFSSIRGSTYFHVLAFRLHLELKCQLEETNGLWELGLWQEIIARLRGRSNWKSRDSCNCWCSEDGCLPSHVLIKRLMPYSFLKQGQHASRLTPWSFLMRKLDLWIELCGGDGGDKEIRREACRLESFERLGMAHTCCHGCWKSPGSGEEHWHWLYMIPFFEVTADLERKELQEEDKCLKKQLDALVQTYEGLQEEFSQQGGDLWKVWWETLEEFLPARVWVLDKRGKHFATYVLEQDTAVDEELPNPKDLWTKMYEIEMRVRLSMGEAQST